MMTTAVAIIWQVRYWHRSSLLSTMRETSIQNAGPGEPPGPLLCGAGSRRQNVSASGGRSGRVGPATAVGLRQSREQLLKHSVQSAQQPTSHQCGHQAYKHEHEEERRDEDGLASPLTGLVELTLELTIASADPV